MQQNKISWLENFHLLDSKATQETGRGRPSGGLVLLLSKNIFHSIEDSIIDSNYISAVAKDKKNVKWLVMVIYLQPSVNNYKELLELVLSTKNELCMRNKVNNILIMGDYNARVGELNNWSEDTWPIQSKKLKCSRMSLDKKFNAKGKILLEIMGGEDLILFNGRTEGDYLGNSTFSNYKGHSVIDLVFVNSDLAEKISFFEVKEWAETEHFASLLTIGKNNNNSQIKESAKKASRMEK